MEPKPTFATNNRASRARLLLVFAAGFVAFLFGSLPQRAVAQSSPPTLIVQITMDQLRGSLLRDYAPVLSHGFRRLESDGYWIRHGDVGYGLTLSFPGHTTLATGMYPSHHGLTLNDWWTQRDGKWASIDIPDDTSFRIIGHPGRAGASPRFLLVKTIGEWVKQADPRAKSIALGSGEFVPISYGGHIADGVYWFDTTANAFTTSTFYSRSPAEWVTNFNQKELPGFQEHTWILTVPQSFVSLAASGEPYARNASDHPFPHIFEHENSNRQGRAESYSQWFNGTPLKDEALFALAARAVDAERLGQRGVVDYLALDIDSTDEVGHRYGPRSIEQLDTLVRLDGALERFLEHLDSVVGKNKYVVALSADHGVADPPESQPGGRRITTAEIEALLDRVEAIARTNVANEGEATDGQLVDKIVAELKRTDFIADVYTEKRLSEPSADSIVKLYQLCFRPAFTTDFPLWSNKEREYHPARYGITVRFKEEMIFDVALAVHGTPYPYDRDVPFIFYGANIRRGSSEEGAVSKATSIDVAPTLAAAAGVRTPENLDGHPLSFVLTDSQGVMTDSQKSGK